MREFFYLAIILSILPARFSAQEVSDTIFTDSIGTGVMLLSASTPTQSFFRSDTSPTPQAAAFNRLGDFTTNNNYGVPDISIPLFEIDFHGFKIPLALHYEAMPLKSGYNYDVTGIGWTLSGNSCVSRTIKDRADEATFLTTGRPFVLDDFSDYSSFNDYTGLFEIVNFQPDVYNIVLPSGRTIPFLMYKEGYTMIYKLMQSDRNVKIECGYNDNNNSIDYFTLTDENGITYHFGQPEKAINDNSTDRVLLKNVTWLLTSITIPSKGQIRYEYTDLVTIQAPTIDEPVYRVNRFSSQMMQDSYIPRLEVVKTFQSQCPRYETKFIKNIYYGPSGISFAYTDDGMHMRDIVVSDCNDTIRHVSLDIDDSRLTTLTISGEGNTDQLVYGFTYQNDNFIHSDRAEIYTDYWGNLCESNVREDLGNFNMYFNRMEAGNTDIIPIVMASNPAWSTHDALILTDRGSAPYYYSKLKLQSEQEGDTRAASSPDVHGVLHTITYPNGGRTVYTFENNRFPTATSADGDLVFDRRSQRIIEGGGFRIKSIVNYTSSGEIANQDHYRYGYTYEDIIARNFPLPLPEHYDITDHIGCGEAVVDPNLMTFMTFSIFDGRYSNETNPYSNGEFLKMITGRESEFRYFYSFQGGARWWNADFSANTFRALLAGRRPVVYPEITVYHGDPETEGSCRSKTVYRYDIYKYDHSPQTNYMSLFNDEHVADTAYFEDVYYYNDAPGLVTLLYPAKRHQLKSASEYSLDADCNTWHPVSKVEYQYTDTDVLMETGLMFNNRISRKNAPNYSNDFSAMQWWEHYSLNDFYIQINQYYNGRHTMSGKTTTIYRQGESHPYENQQIEYYSYIYPDVVKSKTYSDSFDFIFVTDENKGDFYSYVGEEEDSDPVICEMKSRNMLASLVSAEELANIYGVTPIQLEGSKVDYAFFDMRILPSVLYEWSGDCEGNGRYEASMSILAYDDYANPAEIFDMKSGLKSVYLWDSYGRYITAVINNAELSQVQSIYSQVASEDSRSRYQTLKTLLPDCQIQTWDYKPLVGVSSYTDISGRTTLYEYDGLGRLKKEKRKVEGMNTPETVKEYEYNYLNRQL